MNGTRNEIYTSDDGVEDEEAREKRCFSKKAGCTLTEEHLVLTGTMEG